MYPMLAAASLSGHSLNSLLLLANTDHNGLAFCIVQNAFEFEKLLITNGEC